MLTENLCPLCYGVVERVLASVAQVIEGIRHFGWVGGEQVSLNGLPKIVGAAVPKFPAKVPQSAKPSTAQLLDRG